jgi:hypothetical protein
MNEELKKILDEWGAETVAKIIQAIDTNNLKWRGTLRRSIIYQIGEDNIQFLMADYGQFFDQDSGSPRFSKKNKGALAYHLKDWASSKGLNNWAVATNIVKRGGLKRKPVNFFTVVIEKQIAELVPMLDESIVRYLDNRIEIISKENA